MVVVHAYNPSAPEQRQADLCEFKATLVYRVSSRTARAVTQRNPISELLHRKILFRKNKDQKQNNKTSVELGIFREFLKIIF